MRGIDLKYIPNSVTNLRRSPPGFMLSGRLRNDGEATVAIYGAAIECKIVRSVEILTQAAWDVAQVLNPGEDRPYYLTMFLTRDALEAAEAQRDPKEGRIGIRLSMQFIVASMIPIGDQDVVVPGPPRSAVVSLEGTGDQHVYYLSRDEWLSLLRNVGFSEVDVFELPELRLMENEVTKEPVQLLHQAETAFRQGDWDGTLAKCRLAMEAVAKLTGQTNNLRLGFQVLWDKRALAHERHKAKRQPLDDLAGALGDFQHLGRHVEFPYHPIDRDDALLGLRMTLSLFEYIGRRCE